MAELHEFVDETLEGAVEKAARHFGVGRDRLEVGVLSERVAISGIGTRVLVLASVREAPPKVGPAGEFLLGILERMGVGGPIRVDEHSEDGQIVLRVRGDRARDLVRRDPKVQGALTHLVGRALQSSEGPDAAVRIDLAGQNAGEDRLEQMVRDRAKEAQEKGREVVLPPMSGRERWIVHNTLKTISGIRTESVGEGRQKRVKIVPV